MTVSDWSLLLQAASLIVVGLVGASARRVGAVSLRRAGTAALASGLSFLVAALVPALVPANCLEGICARPSPWSEAALVGSILGPCLMGLASALLVAYVRTHPGVARA
jgi:hypothetical protein